LRPLTQALRLMILFLSFVIGALNFIRHSYFVIRIFRDNPLSSFSRLLLK
jgi:hypothetical protein